MYGSNTRSYNRSTEARENKKRVREATEKYLQSQHKPKQLDSSWLMCECDGRPHKHPAHPMREVINFTPWFRWRWNVKSE